MSKYGFLDQIRVIQMETRAPDSAVSDADQAKIGITYVSALSLLIYATVGNIKFLQKIRKNPELIGHLKPKNWSLVAAFGSFALCLHFVKGSFEQLPEERIQQRLKQFEELLERGRPSVVQAAKQAASETKTAMEKASNKLI